jgi:DNA-binding transcriptional regulator YdaS (Cro superfamily)
MNALDLAIEHMGGVGKLAAAIGIGQAAVSNWRARNTLIDPLHCVTIEVATQGAVTRKMLRPHDWRQIWPELVQPNDVVLQAGDAVGYCGISHAVGATDPTLRAA